MKRTLFCSVSLASFSVQAQSFDPSTPAPLIAITQSIRKASHDPHFLPQAQLPDSIQKSVEALPPSSSSSQSPEDAFLQQHAKDSEKKMSETQKNYEKLEKQQKEDYLKKVKEAQKRFQAQVKQWEKIKPVYQKEIPTLKKNLFEFKLVDPNELKKESLKKESSQKETKELIVPRLPQLKIEDTIEFIKPVPPKIQVVEGAFQIPTRHQGMRPTCSAFSAIRAIEIKAYQKYGPLDLSEQYFYWSSKPQCQTSPCNSRGSHASFGLQWSKESHKPNIPLEHQCIYNGVHQVNNDTQTPLSSVCQQGHAQVTQYELLKTTQEIKNALDDNHPVIIDSILDAGYYDNDGWISLQQKQGATDSHAAGHSYVIVGYMPLPEKLKNVEGQICFLITNSWGLGWGQGGHACVSENWLNQKRINTYAMAITNVTYQ